MKPTTPDTGTSTLLLAGATGLIGREWLRLALADPPCRAVHAIVRRVPTDAPSDPRLHWLPADFTDLPPLPAADAAGCALGTTIKVAGSQAAFKAVDFDAALAFARAARAAGVTRFALVSSLGASPRSANFYSRVKGETEEALAGLGFESLVIARPSLLAGDRGSLGQPPRRGERVTLALLRPLQSLIPAAWRPVEAATVARALQKALAAPRSGTRIIESADLQALGRVKT